MIQMQEFDVFYIVLLLSPILLIWLCVLIYRKRDVLSTSGWFLTGVMNLLVLFALLSLVLVFGETYFRFFVDTTDSFALNKITSRWEKRHYQFNNYHWRDNVDYQLSKPNGSVRVTFMGDSFTAGHGIKNVDQRFTNIVRKNHPDWEVHTLASNGFETDDIFETLQQSSKIGYETDLIVLVYNLNDISWLSPEAQTIYSRIFSFNEQLSYLERESYFINTMTFRWKAINDPDIRNYYHFVQNTYDGQLWHRQTQLLQRISRHLREKNVQLMAVTFPFLDDLEDYKFGWVHDELGKFWNSEGVAHLDLLPAFSLHAGESLVVNPYDAHPNEYAHGLVVKEVEVFLTKEFHP